MDCKNILVSVIVPIYNVEDYLEKCVNSIINQTYKNLEIILVDDGSTDKSSEICDSFALKDNRIKVVHKVNGGLSDARNAGIDIANGTYYSFIDSDDYISENTIESLLKCALDASSEIAICNIIKFNKKGIESPFYCPVNKKTIYNGIDRFKTLNQPSVCNKLFYARLFDNIRFPKGKYYEDTFVYHELLYKANSVVLTGENGYWYLTRDSGIIEQSKYNKNYFDFIEAVWLRAKFLIEHGIQPYGNEACLSLYVAVSNMEKNLIKTSENIDCFKLAKERYRFAYSILMKKGTKIGIKQKIRLVLLRYLPKLHKKLYGG
ncbi:glycosyltransferase family 2 protein [Erysipelatoclostridium sp. An173]|uniref:glycosyltransferase family 2 protein n=1 Tax=Erysipelatoclostridium sp. An173 TaxID=1965571 RepID=UPI00320A34F3